MQSQDTGARPCVAAYACMAGAIALAIYFARLHYIHIDWSLAFVEVFMRRMDWQWAAGGFVIAIIGCIVWGLPPATDPLYPTVGLSTPEQKSGERFKVISVAKDSPAAAAGFQVGDELVAIDGVPYADKETVNRLLSGKRWGDRVEYKVLRGGQDQGLTVLLRRQKPKQEER